MAVRCDGKIQNIKFKKIELLAGTLVKPKKAGITSCDGRRKIV